MIKHRPHPTSHTTELLGLGERQSPQGSENVCTEDSAVGSRVYQEECLYPRTITSQHLAADHGSDDPISTEEPQAVELHRYDPFFPGECRA